MTAETRLVIRALRDRHARATVARFVASGELRLCSGCDGPTDCVTPGCKACFDRKRNRTRSRMDSINAYRRRRRAMRRQP